MPWNKRSGALEMRQANYAQGLAVTKTIAGGDGNGFAAISKTKRGVTLCEAPYRKAGSTAWYCKVQWQHTAVPEEMCLGVLVAIQQEAQAS